MPLISSRVTALIENPVASRTDLARLLLGLLEPLVDAQSDGGARVRLGAGVVGYDDAAAELEGFSRALWGLAPLFAGGVTEHGEWEGIRKRWVDGLSNGTDPEHTEYWGESEDVDQRLVEQAGVALAILIAPHAFWFPLANSARTQLEAWLLRGNDRRHPCTNWRFFRILVNLALKSVGAAYSPETIERELAVTETFIGAHNLPSDGPDGESPSYDYYATSFAIPFYGMIFSKHYPEHPLATTWRARARDMAPLVARLFAPDGAAIPFGRSMIYRFACVALWSAAVYAEIELPEPFSLGVVKGMILRHIRWFTTSKDVFHRDGSLSIGWAYPTAYISEDYTSPQGPYWALKSFLILALLSSHAFWTTPEEPYPVALPRTLAVPAWKQVFVRAAGHTYMLTSGQMSFRPQRNDAAKYSKLAYSAAFGFSLPTDSLRLGGMGADSTLLVSRDGRRWVHRRECEGGVEEGGVVRSVWRPEDAVRPHRAVSPTSTRPDQAHGRWSDGRSSLIHSLGGVSAISTLLLCSGENGPRPVILDMDPGSNLISPRTLVPTLQGAVGQGTTWLASRVFAIPRASEAYDGWAAALNGMLSQRYESVQALALALGVRLE